MSEIKALESLSGTISGKCELLGDLCSPKEYPEYEGSYEIVPRPYFPLRLETANKVMKQNLVIKEVPYFETSNEFDGKTAYIGNKI